MLANSVMEEAAERASLFLSLHHPHLHHPHLHLSHVGLHLNGECDLKSRLQRYLTDHRSDGLSTRATFSEQQYLKRRNQ